jgi:AsmA protein
VKKTLKISGIVAGVIILILLFMVFSPLLFREKFAAIVKSTANKELKTEMNFSEMNVSFFRHFPNLTITLTDFSLQSSAPFTNDTVISARDISFGVNLKSLFSGPIRISKVYINRGRVVMRYNQNGASNFDVYNASADSSQNADTSTSEPVHIQIDNIIFIKTDFIYSDATIPLTVEAHGINYHGVSKLTEDIFRLTSRVGIDSLDVTYDMVRYIKSKPIKANLTTSINLNSLNMKFEKNDFRISDIPFEFKGEFAFRKDGYSFFVSLFSMLGKEYFSGSVYLVSQKNLWVSVKADVNLDLQNWTKGLNIKDYALAGLFTMKLKALGEYSAGQDPASSKPGLVIHSIPDFTFSSKLTKGSIRIGQLKETISDISFNIEANSRDHDYRSVNVQLENLRATFLKNTLEGYFRLKGLKDFPIEARLATRINLAEISRVIPLDSLDLKGMLDMNLDVQGNYAPEKMLFPVADVSLHLKNGSIQTKYYPKPVENINLLAKVQNRNGRLSGTRVEVSPLSFTFEGNPFELTAELVNPENLVYDIAAKGSVDVAGIYRLFSVQGMDLNGFASMDLRLKGRQDDAMAGRVEKLQNSGRLELRDIAFTSEFLPLPLIINKGIFRFENDNLWFEKFRSRYGASDINMDGHLSNVVNYILSDTQKLKGSFTFRSDYLQVDEFMAPAGQPEAGSVQPADTIQPPAGVIVIPANLEVGVKANLKKVRYGSVDFRNLDANVEVKQGMLLLKGMSFDVIGCKVGMDATYGSVSPTRAFFDFHVKADSFDIKRAYNELELFRNLSTSAGKCEGIVSLEYTLKGRLDEGMNPIYPSLEGQGVIRLEKVKVMGLKLFTSMSRNLGKEEIKNPDLSKVELRTTIKKNVITLEKTRMKISGFRFRIGGETSFTGQLNLKARLGLPPMGIVGIPMRILGTQNNPKFKYGRGTGDEDVAETDYSDEVPPEMLDKIRNAKAEELKDEPQ